MTRDMVIKKCDTQRKQLLAKGAYMHIPHKNFEYAVEVGLRMLVLRKVIAEKDEKYHLVPDEIPLLSYYSNAISHLG